MATELGAKYHEDSGLPAQYLETVQEFMKQSNQSVATPKKVGLSKISQKLGKKRKW